MQKRTRVFLVKTDWWYIERLVWLIAGTLVLSSSVLSAVHHPNWSFLILFTALCSIMVALTGFCIVGNILYFLGVQPLVPDKRTYNGGKWSRLYFMENDEWFLERYIYIFVGVNLTISSMLARFLHPGWYFFTGFVGTATVVFAFSGFCIMANFLYRIGLESRMCRFL